MLAGRRGAGGERDACPGRGAQTEGATQTPSHDLTG